MRTFALLLVAAALAACATRGERTTADSGIAQGFERTLVARADPVVRHVIAGRVYYYLTSPCCDFYNPLFDERGKYICAPDGGFSGRGDGRCPAEVRLGAGESVPNPFYAR